ncbi:MAG: SAM-dependent methyltransferase [Bacteriovoracaceae bacterium]
MKLNGVGKTGLLVAAMRARESERSEADGPLFSDPFARALAGTDGWYIWKIATDAVGEQPSIALRTRYFDDRIKLALEQGVRQIVILAAGMDSRAYRLKFPVNTKIYELDRAEVLAYKQERLIGARLQCERSEIAVDLKDDWEKKLIEAGFKKGEKTVWIVEGLLMYLDESAVVSLFKRINSLATSQDILLSDILSLTFLKAPFLAPQIEFLKKIEAPWIFGTDEPEKFLENLGWKANVIQTGDVAPHRWHMPVIPRNIPNVPRGFLVEAVKN